MMMAFQWLHRQPENQQDPLVIVPNHFSGGCWVDVKGDASWRDLSRPRPWGQTEGGKGPLFKAQCLGGGRREQADRVLCSWVQQHLWFCSLLRDGIPCLWLVVVSVWMGRHRGTGPAPTGTLALPVTHHKGPSCLTRYAFHHGSQNILLMLRAALVGGKGRIYCSILEVARWNHWETGQPHTANQCRPRTGSHAPTLLLWLWRLFPRQGKIEHSLERKFIIF